MYHLLENDVSLLMRPHLGLLITNEKFQVEQISQMAYFAEALLEYHQQCTEILKGLVETMQEKLVSDAFVVFTSI